MGVKSRATIRRLAHPSLVRDDQNELARDRCLRSRASCLLVTSVIGLPMASPGPFTVRAFFIGGLFGDAFVSIESRPQ
jgi:hypothetical protein